MVEGAETVLNRDKICDLSIVWFLNRVIKYLYK